MGACSVHKIRYHTLLHLKYTQLFYVGTKRGVIFYAKVGVFREQIAEENIWKKMQITTQRGGY
jgi:hypothetical protein